MIMVVWLVRVRRAAAAGDEMTGFALTGVVGCLISPITWVHHLVWVGPAILLRRRRAGRPRPRRRRRACWGFTIFSYVLLCSRLVWVFEPDRRRSTGSWAATPTCWISIALLVLLPIRPRGGAAGTAQP